MSSAPESGETLLLTAYQVKAAAQDLCAGKLKRDWMDGTLEHFAYRCLPLNIANQLGWDILCPLDFTAIWDGTDRKKCISLRFPGASSEIVSSHFGSGVLTFQIGYLFRTPRGHDLWVKGPPHQPKDGIAPLEGVVETDWSPFTFTMNWLFTRPHHEVAFQTGEPICRILPYPREYIAGFTPTVRPVESNPELFRQYQEWQEARKQFNKDLKFSITDASQLKWMKSYFLGKTHEGADAAGHQTKITLREFTRE